jgi:hypothetical protein
VSVSMRVSMSMSMCMSVGMGRRMYSSGCVCKSARACAVRNGTGSIRAHGLIYGGCTVNARQMLNFNIVACC